MAIFSFLKRRKSPSCDEIMEVLQSYLDGETEAKVARDVSTHLDMCVDCGPEHAVYMRIKETLSTTAEPVDPIVLRRLEDFGMKLTQHK